MLVINPNPADANEYAPFMKDEIEMRVVAEIHDEHAQVVSHYIIIINHIVIIRSWISSFNLSLS